MSEEKIKTKEEMIETVKKYNEEGVICKLVRIGSSFFILKPLMIDTYLQYKTANYDAKTEEEFIMNQIIEHNKSMLYAGDFELIKEKIFEVSGFGQEALVVFDPIKNKYNMTIEDIANKYKSEYPDMRIIIVNDLPIAIKSITTDEYFTYRSEVEKLSQIVDDNKRFEDAFKLDIELAKSHIIYPSDITEPGYFELIFSALWRVSGFAQESEIIEV